MSCLQKLELAKISPTGTPVEIFFGFFQLRSALNNKLLWWLCLIINGEVISYGDCVFYSYENAVYMSEKIEKATGLAKGMYKFFDSVNESEAFLRDHIRLSLIDNYVKNIGVPAKINTFVSSVTRSKILWLTIGGAICALMILIPRAIMVHLDNIAQAEARERMRAERMEIMKNPSKYFSKTWVTSPVPGDFANACLQKMLTIPLHSNGWEFVDSQCQGKNVKVNWEYADGANFLDLPEKAKLDERNLKHAQAVFPLEIQSSPRDEKLNDHKNLLSREEMMSMMSEITQTTNSKLQKVKFGPQETKKVKSVTVTAPWHQSPWELDSIPDQLITPDPNGLFGMLSHVPGITVNEITFSMAKGWSVKGDIYVKH